jgi:hypothetical protein
MKTMRVTVSKILSQSLERYKRMCYECGLEPIDPKGLKNSNRSELTDEVLGTMVSIAQVQCYHAVYFSILENFVQGEMKLCVHSTVKSFQETILAFW